MKRKTLVIAISGLIAVIGVCLVAFLLLSHGGSNLPMAATKLPDSIQSLSIGAIPGSSEKDAKLKDMLIASRLASIVCAPDYPVIADMLKTMLRSKDDKVKGDGAPLSRYVDADSLTRVKLALSCGQTLAIGLKSNLETSLSLEVEAGEDNKNGAKVDVRVMQMQATELPSALGWTKRKFGDRDGFCYVPPKDGVSPECSDTSTAAFNDGTTWYVGPLKGIELVVKAVTKPKDALSSAVENIRDAGGALDGLDVGFVTTKPAGAWGHLFWDCATFGADSSDKDAFMKACVPDSAAKALERVDSQLRAAAYELDNIDHIDGKLRSNVILVMRDADAAKDAEKDVLEVEKDWKAQVANNESKLLKLMDRGDKKDKSKIRRALANAFVRGVQHATVSRSGRTLRISMNEPLSDSDRSDYRDAIEAGNTNQGPILDVLTAILNNSKPALGALEAIVGKESAATLLAKWGIELPQKLALKECDSGVLASCAKLGEMYESGENDLPKDDKRAVALYQKACNGKDPTGCYEMAFRQIKGDGVEKNGKLAMENGMLACNANHNDACRLVGWMYATGTEVAKDFTKAAPLLQKACDGKEATGCGILALLYWGGDGVPKDHSNAAKLAAIACEGNDLLGQGCLLLCLMHGAGDTFDKDVHAAVPYCKKGCAAGNKVACDALKKLEGNDDTESSESNGPTITRQASIAQEQCTSKGYPPNSFSYTGGTYAENQKAALAAGCVKLLRFENNEYCCP